MPHTSNPGDRTKLFSRDLFRGFLDDLLVHESVGLAEPECRINRLWLERLSNAAVVIPDGHILGRKIYQRIDDILVTYIAWNDGGNEPATYRAGYRSKIKKRINRLASAYRVRTEILRRELDLNVYEAMYEATLEAIRAAPDLMKHLGRVLSRWSRYQVLQSGE